MEKEQPEPKRKAAQKRIAELEIQPAYNTNDSPKTGKLPPEFRNHFDVLFATMSQGVVYQDAEGAIILANPAAERILGLSLDEMQGRKPVDPCWRAIHKDGSSFPSEQHPAMVALRTGKAVQDVVMGIFRPKEDDYRWILVNAVPEFRRGITLPYQVYITFTDITELRKAEEALHRREQELQTLLEHSPDAIMRFDLQGRYLYANPARARFFGLPPEEIVGKTWWDLLGPDEEEEGKIADRQFRKILEDPREYTVEYQTLTPQGLRWVQSREVPEFAKDGSLESVLVVTRDITELKHVEQDLRQSNERFTQVANNISEIFWVADPATGKIVYVNPAFESIVGLSLVSVEQLPGGFLDLVLPEDRHLLVEAFEQEALGMKVEIQYRFHRPDGRIRWFQYKGSPVFDKDGNIVSVVGVTRDLTEQLEAQSRLRQSEARFRHMTDTIREVFWMYDIRQKTFSYVSPAYEKIWGRSVESLFEEKEQFFEAIHPDDKGIVSAALERQARGEKTESEYRIMHPDGSIRNIYDRSYPILDENGVVILTTGIATDVTEHKLRDEQFQQRLMDLELINTINRAVERGDNLQEIILCLSAGIRPAFGCLATIACLPNDEKDQLNIIDLNIHPSQLTQIEMMLGRHVADLSLQAPLKGNGYFAKAARACLPNIVNRRAGIQAIMSEFMGNLALRKYISPIYELLGIRSTMLVPLLVDEEVIGFLTLNRKELFTASELNRIQVIAAQLTAAIRRKHVEQALHLSEEKYRGLMESLKDGVAAVDYKGFLLYIDGVAAMQLGGTPQDFVGKTIQELFPSPVASEHLEAIQKVFRENRGITIESQSIMQGNIHRYRAIIQPIHDKNGFVVHALVNITPI